MNINSVGFPKGDMHFIAGHSTSGKSFYPYLVPNSPRFRFDFESGLINPFQIGQDPNITLFSLWQNYSSCRRMEMK